MVFAPSDSGGAPVLAATSSDEAAKLYADQRAGLDEVCRLYGGLDVLVLNAGIAHVSPLADLDAGALRRVMDVNFMGYFLVLREASRLMKRQGTGGNVIVNSSKNVFAPGADFGAYSASKAAGHQLAKVAAMELAQSQGLAAALPELERRRALFAAGKKLSGS